jgi:hypothetical protein
MITNNNLGEKGKGKVEGAECVVSFELEGWQCRGIAGLARFAHPYLLGWHLLNSLKYSEFEE